MVLRRPIFGVWWRSWDSTTSFDSILRPRKLGSFSTPLTSLCIRAASRVSPWSCSRPWPQVFPSWRKRRAVRQKWFTTKRPADWYRSVMSRGSLLRSRICCRIVSVLNGSRGPPGRLSSPSTTPRAGSADRGDLPQHARRASCRCEQDRTDSLDGQIAQARSTEECGHLATRVVRRRHASHAPVAGTRDGPRCKS